jgi:hypothetical protein
VVGILLLVLGFFVLVIALILATVEGALGALIAFFALLLFGGGVLLIYQAQQKPTKAVALPAPSFHPPAGTVTKVIQPGTVAITPPSGGTITVSAWLQAPSGSIPITRLPQEFGRDDFRNLVSPQLLSAISRRHFAIGYDYVSGNFVVWDLESMNGTFVNGVDIRGKGPVPIKYGDTIAPANAIQLRFAPSATH